MRRNRVMAALILLLSVVVVGSMAAGYETAGTVDLGGSGEGATSDGGSGGVASLFGFPAWVVEYWLVLVFGGSVAAGLIITAYLYWSRGMAGLRDLLRWWTDTLLGGLLYVMVIGFAGLMWWLLSSQPLSPANQNGQPPGGGQAGPQGPSGGEVVAGMDYRWVLLGMVLVLGVLVFFVVDHRRRSDSPPAEPGTGAPPAEELVEGEGGPIDRGETIEDVPASNPVYRAWLEMATDAVESTDQTLTAEEVARRAMAAGHDSTAVQTLTRLFEEVRYGHHPVTDDRIQRARDALSSIDGVEARLERSEGSA